eukprot:TRINITY_DN11040_c0_g1_i2.p1 TRINITY_DN11040_c0_g1~~TRINITY_DN11040_c0_g1_i2.p1  ORF type:complete len:716 (-),score=206.62 TRINITY_DN11040_c0_g1_i2:93-2240(-)
MRGSGQSPGIIPLSIMELFKEIAKGKEKAYQVRVSYLELYNETINDLLVAENKDLEVRESLHGVYIKDLCEIEVRSPEQALEQLYSGDVLKKVGETKLNEQSSRSHTVFRLNIQSKPVDSSDETAIVSQLNLVDLAGSEGVSRTKAEGIRLREGVNINRSLLALSNVIYRLSVSSGKFINYRDSKLTRILQPALGGNSKTAIICTISQLKINYQESYNTLLFGVKAKKIKNSVKVNEVIENTDKRLQFALKEIKKLKDELKHIKGSKQKEVCSLAESIVSIWENKVERLRELITKRAIESGESQIISGFEAMKEEFLKLTRILCNAQGDNLGKKTFENVKCETLKQESKDLECSQKMETDGMNLCETVEATNTEIKRITELECKLKNERQKRVVAEEEKTQLRRNAEQILCESIEECERLYIELKETIDAKDKLQLEHNLCRNELEALKKGLNFPLQSEDTRKKDDLIVLYQSNNEFLKKELARVRGENAAKECGKKETARGRRELPSPRNVPARVDSDQSRKKTRNEMEVLKEAKKQDEYEKKNKQLTSKIKECMKEIEGLKTDKNALLLKLKQIKKNDITEAMNIQLVAKENVIQQLLKEKDELVYANSEAVKALEGRLKEREKEVELANRRLRGMESKYRKLYRKLEDSLADEKLVDKMNLRVSEESNFECKVKVIEILDQSEYLKTIKDFPCLRNKRLSPENKENVNELNN